MLVRAVGNSTGADALYSVDQQGASGWSWGLEGNLAFKNDWNFGTNFKAYLAPTGWWYTQSGSSTFSDLRYKENLQVIDGALDRISKLTGYTFTRNDIGDSNQRQAALIAQDMQKVLPEVVAENHEGRLTVAYGKVVALLVNGIKEVAVEVRSLQDEKLIIAAGYK
jgi:hypothetical protein